MKIIAPYFEILEDLDKGCLIVEIHFVKLDGCHENRSARLLRAGARPVSTPGSISYPLLPREESRIGSAQVP